MIIWHNPATTLPEPLTDVLLAVRGEKLASEGFMLSSHEWVFSTGHPVDAAKVYAWTELPACPVESAVCPPSSAVRSAGGVS